MNKSINKSIKIEIIITTKTGSLVNMLSNKNDAINTLTENNTNPEIVINHLRFTPNAITIYKDSSDILWTYITRGRTRLYLMAKAEFMNNYEEIYWIRNK